MSKSRKTDYKETPHWFDCACGCHALRVDVCEWTCEPDLMATDPRDVHVDLSFWTKSSHSNWRTRVKYALRVLKGEVQEDYLTFNALEMESIIARLQAVADQAQALRESKFSPIKIDTGPGE